MSEKDYKLELITENDKKIVLTYLTENKIINNKTYKSSYYACLEHARDLTGRCQKDGSLEYKEKIGNWAGACMYMILIDHIGCLFRKNKKEEVKDFKNTNFLMALSHFSNISNEHAKILYQLRNSFVHSFNLFNFPENKNKNISRIFSVHRGSDLIGLPSEDWVGSAVIKKENQTRISLFKLGNLAEKMHRNILENLNKNMLEIRILKEGNFTIKRMLEINTICY
jgi:hypothetical protein